MPSKLQKAIAAVKDQTSISLAKVKTTTTSTPAALEVAILKATTHDDIPTNEQHVQLILLMTSSSRAHASACARALGRRITRTRNYAVALKSLLLVLRLFQDGDPHFPKEVLSAMKRGYRILNLSSFSAPGSDSWHFTAFVRTFALYLDDRLHCFLTGRLVHRRLTSSSVPNKPPLDMKPPLLLDRLSHWQRLLDRAVGTRPTGPAKSNRLVHTCLYAVVNESFDLYRDISNGVALLLDGFFHLEYPSSARAYQAFLKAEKQFSELGVFYEFCKTVGVGGRSCDYPSVTGMSRDLLDTLHDFLKDHQQQPNSTASPSTTAFRGRARGTSLGDLIGDISSDAPLELAPSCRSDPGDDDKAVASDDLDLASVMSDPTSTSFSAPDFLEVDDDEIEFEGVSGTGWELALMDGSNDCGVGVEFDGDPSSSHQYNPFLHDHLFFDVPPTSGVDFFGTFEGSEVNGNSGHVLEQFHSGQANSIQGSLENCNSETISNPIGTSSPFDLFASLRIRSTEA